MFLLLGVFFVLLNVRLASLPRNFCEFSLKRASGVYKILSKISTKFRDNVIERNSTSFVCITFAQYCAFGQHNPYRDASEVDCIQECFKVRQLAGSKSAMRIVPKFATRNMGNVRAILTAMSKGKQYTCTFRHFMLRNLEVNTGTERPSSSSVSHDSYGRIDVLGRNQRTSVDRPEMNTNQGMPTTFVILLKISMKFHLRERPNNSKSSIRHSFRGRK